MKLHRLAAILVLIASAAWVFTGEFSFVGSAADEQGENTVVARQEAAQAAQGETLQAVSVATVPSFEHSRTVRISGITKADKQIDVTARANGVIASLSVAQGDIVSEGDEILRLNPEGRDAQLAAAEQALEQAKIDATSTERLVNNGTLPSQRLDAAKSALRQAESQVEIAKAEVERLVVSAPFSGVIDDLMVEQGGAVQPGAPVAKLIALDPIIGVGEVNESDLSIVKVGNDASIRLVTGDIVDGKIRYISRQAQANTRTYTTEIEVANEDLSIPAGMTTEVILRGEPVRAKPVPRSIVTLNSVGELGIRSVDDEDKVVFHPIDIVDDSTGALILGGIPEDARIIVSGQNLVAEGQKVEVVPADQELVDRLISEARSQIEGM